MKSIKAVRFRLIGNSCNSASTPGSQPQLWSGILLTSSFKRWSVTMYIYIVTLPKWLPHLTVLHWPLHTDRLLSWTWVKTWIQTSLLSPMVKKHDFYIIVLKAIILCHWCCSICSHLVIKIVFFLILGFTLFIFSSIVGFIWLKWNQLHLFYRM